MPKNGLRIKNIQCASIYECNAGVRDQLDSKDAVIANSLFLDFLLENGLNVWKGESTRDLIVIEYSYGTRSYESERKHFDKLISNIEKELSEEISDRKRSILDKKLANIKKLSDDCNRNKSEYKKISKQNLRVDTYKHGISVTYYNHRKGGMKTIDEIIHYKMLTRTPGKAKLGRVTFIRDELYDIAKDFLYMGITLPDHDAPIVEIGAYSSLITSGIVGRVRIEPKEILVLKDVDSYFTTNVISVEINNRNECVVVHKDNYQVKNTIFDGEALADDSLFPEWGNSFLLLRNHFFKAAAFRTKIQDFFRDYCVDNNIDYDRFTVVDMWGNEHYAKDIKLITTDQATKFIKFDNVTFEDWCNRMKWNDYHFGIVKTDHRSHTYPYQKMSYQMVNTLMVEDMREAMLPTENYITKLQTDNDAFIKYLEDNKNFSNDYEVLVALVGQDRDFIRSDYFRARKKQIINAYVLNMKSGKLMQDAENEVIVGSPYALLLHAVGEDVMKDPTFEIENDCIQCYAPRFKDGEYLAAFRSPHNAKSNILYFHNHYHPLLEKYFVFGDCIVAVNLQGTDSEDRGNGHDMDSDMFYMTNYSPVVRAAKDAYANYPTIVNNIPKDKNHYDNTPEDFALIDNRLAASQIGIGLSSNLAQVCLSYSYSFDDSKYQDYACILSVLAQVCIDSSKRAFSVDPVAEIDRIKKDMNIPENKYPAFWQIIKPEFKPIKKTKGGEKIDMVNHKLKCPMNELYKFKPSKHRSPESTLPLSTFFVKYEPVDSKRKCRKVEDLIEKYSFNLYKYHIDDTTEVEDTVLMTELFDELIEDIKQIYISNNYLSLMSYLINRAFRITAQSKGKRDVTQSTLSKNRALLLKTLYRIAPDQLLKVFAGNVRRFDVSQEK